MVLDRHAVTNRLTVALKARGAHASARQLRHYDRTWLRGDLIAGVTVAAYLVPQVLAYAGVAGLPPVTGLWAAVAALLAYALIGSSRRLSVGPESTTALLTAAALAPIAAGDPRRYAALAATLAAMVGLICLLAWAARLGFLADLLSRPVLIGYMTGIAALMVSSQLGTLTGLPVDSGPFHTEVASFAKHAVDVNWASATVSAATLLFLFGAARVAPRAPIPLLGVGLAAAVVAMLSLEDQGVALVGGVPGGLPAHPAWVGVADLRHLVLPALGLAVVAYTDNMLTARAFAARHREDVDAGQELLALAAANMAAAAAHGMPVSSSGSRTAIGDANGARSQAHSLVAAVMVLLTLGLLSPLVAEIPKPALGALVVWAATRLVDIGEFRRIARFRRSELFLALATVAAVLLLDVLTAVLVAVGLSLLDLLRRVARPHDGLLGYVPGVPGMHDVDDYPDARLVPGLLVYRYDSPLFFANADDFLRRALSTADSFGDPLYWFVLNAEANVAIDITSLDALDKLRTALSARGVVFALTRVKHELATDLARAGFLDRLGAGHVFATLPTAAAAYADWCKTRHPELLPDLNIVPPPPEP
jgi:high affinity sulfate transporter 1